MYRMIWTVLILTILALAAPSAAQEIQLAVQGPLNGGERPLSLLSAPAGLTVDDRPLTEALLLLGERSGVTLAFSPSFIRDDHRVACDCGDRTVGEVLDHMLDQTGLVYWEVGNRVVISRSSAMTRMPERRVLRQRGDVPASRTLDVLPVPDRSLHIPAVRQGVVTGQVRTGAGRPLAGVMVRIPELGLGTITGTDGRYRLEDVPAGEVVLKAAVIGFHAAEERAVVRSGQTTVVDFQLAEDAVRLDEVVVTGTADRQRRRELGTSLSQLTRADIELTPVRNIQDILYGQAPGVLLTANSGQPGAAATIRLRGLNSISQANEPLIYVDGVRLFSQPILGGGDERGGRQGISPLNSVRPEDIERIEIVKGAAATTLYGTEASGGVIQIFTRRGTDGPTQWSAEIQTGVNQIGYIGPPGDDTGLGLLDCRTYENSLGETFADPTCPSDGNWVRDGLIQRYSLSVSGGSSDFDYYVSGNFADERQPIKRGGFDRPVGLRANFNFLPLDNLTLSLNSAYIGRTTEWLQDGSSSAGFFTNVVRGPGGRWMIDGNPNNALGLDFENVNDTNHFVGGLTARYHSGGDWTHRLTVGYDYFNTEGSTLWPFGHIYEPEGRFWKRHHTRATVTLDYLTALRHQLTQSLGTSLSFGGQYFDEDSRRLYSQGYGFAGPGEPTIDAAALTQVTTDRALRNVNAGFFVQNVFDFEDRLFLTLGVRVDGNSAFGSNFGLQSYPKASVSYVLSDHEFWPTDWWEAFRVRAAVGDAGRAPGVFDAVSTWEPISAEGGQPGFTPANLGNPDLGPERTREYEVGFESSTFSGRLGVDFTYFHQDTYDALVPVRSAPSAGFSSRQLDNVGHLRNTGFEARLQVGLVRRQAVDWTTTLNASTNWSEAIDLNGEDISMGWRSWAREGYPIASLWGARVVNANEFADPIIEEDAFIGPLYAPYVIGLQNTVRLGERITASALGEWQFGHFAQNGTGYQNARRGDGVWRPCFEAQRALLAAEAGDPSALDNVTALERVKCSMSDFSWDWWMQPADFFKLRSVSVSYDWPERWLPAAADRASLQVAGRNLLTVTDYDGVDPESGDFGATNLQRRDYYNLPPSRSFVVTLRVHF